VHAQGRLQLLGGTDLGARRLREMMLVFGAEMKGEVAAAIAICLPKHAGHADAAAIVQRHMRQAAQAVRGVGSRVTVWWLQQSGALPSDIPL
jgi:hypothetical protein